MDELLTLTQISHLTNETFTLFEDLLHLFNIKVYQGPVVCFLPVVKQLVVMLPPFDGQLFPLDVISVEKRSDLAVFPAGLPGSY
jgi:hypothetical protein